MMKRFQKWATVLLSVENMILIAMTVVGAVLALRGDLSSRDYMTALIVLLCLRLIRDVEE